MGSVCSSATYRSTEPPVVSTLSGLLSKQLISVLGVARSLTSWKKTPPGVRRRLPSLVTSVRDGGRRQRSSPMPGCNGQDMVKVCQGKPVKREANGGREEGR